MGNAAPLQIPGRIGPERFPSSKATPLDTQIQLSLIPPNTSEQLPAVDSVLRIVQLLNLPSHS